jgi:hypothetical protein
MRNALAEVSTVRVDRSVNNNERGS